MAKQICFVLSMIVGMASANGYGSYGGYGAAGHAGQLLAGPAPTIALASPAMLAARPLSLSGAAFAGPAFGGPILAGAALAGPAIVPAAIQSNHHVSFYEVPSTGAIQPVTIDVPANILPVNFHFRSASSNINLVSSHIGGKGSIKETSSVDDPHILKHQVTKPIIQEVKEVITPYRRISQVVEPVREEIQTMVARGVPGGVVATAAAPLALAPAAPLALNAGGPIALDGAGGLGLAAGGPIGGSVLATKGMAFSGLGAKAHFAKY